MDAYICEAVLSLSILDGFIQKSVNCGILAFTYTGIINMEDGKQGLEE